MKLEAGEKLKTALKNKSLRKDDVYVDCDTDRDINPDANGGANSNADVDANGVHQSWK